MEDYFSYDDSSDSDFDSISIGNITNKDYETSSFQERVKNKQVETLKLLRQALSENKILKKRINLIENEFDKLQSNLDITSAIKPRKTSLTKEKSIINDEKKNESNLIVKLDQYVQTSPLPPIEPITIIQREDTKIQVKSITPQIELELENNDEPESTSIFFLKKSPSFIKIQTPQPSIILFDKECQCNEDNEKSNMILLDLKNQLELLQINSENEIKTLNEKTEELNKLNQELTDSKTLLEQSFELLNVKLSESLKANLVLMDDNQQITPLKRLVEFLKAENDQIGDYLKSTQLRLQDKEKQSDELNQKLMNLNKNLEENEVKINYLTAENEKHTKEKHIICQQKISDLINDCSKYKEKISILENENAKQNETIINLNKHIERYKIEQQNFNFKEFVAIKRELNQLKEEKERQFANAVIVPSTSLTTLPQSPLPPIKPSKKNLFNFFNQNTKADK
jgi:hypothetical protein